MSLLVGRVVFALAFALLGLMPILLPGVYHRDLSRHIINAISGVCGFMAGMLLGSLLAA